MSTIENASEKDKQENAAEQASHDVFSDIKYICNSTSLIVDSLQKGLDVAQLPSGEIMVTEIKTVNTIYGWDKDKNKMVKISQN